jgi:hypothetical protein
MSERELIGAGSPCGGPVEGLDEDVMQPRCPAAFTLRHRDAPSDDHRGALSRGQPALLERAPVHPGTVRCRLVADGLEADGVVASCGESAGERR